MSPPNGPDATSGGPQFAGSNRSQSATSSPQNTEAEPTATDSSPIALSSRKHRGATYRPWAFTDYGSLMAANVLRSSRAREMSRFVIRSFVRMREEFVANAAILKRLAAIDKTLLGHDSALHDVYRKLLPLLEPPPETPKPKIGFHRGNRQDPVLIHWALIIEAWSFTPRRRTASSSALCPWSSEIPKEHPRQSEDGITRMEADSGSGQAASCPSCPSCRRIGQVSWHAVPSHHPR